MGQCEQNRARFADGEHLDLLIVEHYVLFEKALLPHLVMVHIGLDRYRAGTEL